MVKDEDGKPVYTSTTYGHQLRVMVSQGEGTLGGPHDPELESGRVYRWRVLPPYIEDPSECPEVEFRLLRPEESAEAEARFEAESKRLGVGEESKQPEGEIALAGMYVKEGFHGEAETLLQQLQERGWDDPRIEALLEDIYRKTGRQLSQRALSSQP